MEPAVTPEEVVARAEVYLRTHIQTPVRMSTLCRVVGRSERGLRNAFYGVHGMGPKRWILTERLRRVRRALSDNAAKAATVTDVATGYGFYELGRFAASYRQAFGEAPSETLRGAVRKSVVQHPSNTKGHADACTNERSPCDGSGRTLDRYSPAGARSM